MYMQGDTKDRGGIEKEKRVGEINKKRNGNSNKKGNENNKGEKINKQLLDTLCKEKKQKQNKTTKLNEKATKMDIVETQ